MKTRHAIGCLLGILLFTPISCVVVWVGGGLWLSRQPAEVGENEEHVSWLPDEATNVSYYKAYMWKAYEFDISEEGFKRWAIKWDLKEIDEEQSIWRYSYMSFLAKRREENVDYDELFSEEEKHIATVKNGLYDKKKSRSSSGYHVVYDRDRGRAYFESSRR